MFAFGGAGFHGSLGATRPARPIVGIAATPSGNGYRLVGSDGGVFTFGDARCFGSLGGTTIHQLAVGVAATPAGDGYWVVLNGGCGPTSLSPITSAGSGRYAIQTSLDIRTQPGCDTVRFGFRLASTGGVPFGVQVARPPFEGPAGVPIAVRGRSFLEARVFPWGGSRSRDRPTDVPPASRGGTDWLTRSRHAQPGSAGLGVTRSTVA